MKSGRNWKFTTNTSLGAKRKGTTVDYKAFAFGIIVGVVLSALGVTRLLTRPITG